MGIQLERLASRSDAAWDAFLDTAPDATLFDRLSFLNYHPEHRFREHRLRAVRDGRTLAVIALAEAETADATWLVSPYGASLGGWVTAPTLRGEDHRELADRLRRYALDHAFDGVAIGARPTPYHSHGEWLEFAWGQCGAECARREINHFVPLEGDVAARMRGSARRSARKAERDGVEIRSVTGEGNGVAIAAAGSHPLRTDAGQRDSDLEAFHRMLARDKAHKNSAPTHTLPELRDLFARFPSEFELLLAEQGGSLRAGLLVIRSSPRIPMVFYCARPIQQGSHGAVNLLYERAAFDAAERGARWLDLGTSSIGGRVNAGLSWFKESVGGVPFVRATWRLDLRPSLPAARRDLDLRWVTRAASTAVT